MQKLSERLGQQFYVENKPGNSGSIGSASFARYACATQRKFGTASCERNVLQAQQGGQ